MENNNLLNDLLLEQVTGGACENSRNSSENNITDCEIYAAADGGAPIPEEHVVKPAILE